MWDWLYGPRYELSNAAILALIGIGFYLGKRRKK